MRLAAEQAALRRVATLVAADAPPERIFESVSEEAAHVVEADSGAIARFQDGSAVIVGRWDERSELEFPVGLALSTSDDGTIARVYRTGAAARINDYAAIGGDGARRVRASGVTTVVAAPIHVAGGLWGAIAVGARAQRLLPPATEDRLREFAELVSVAVAGAEAREALFESRRRVVEAADAERQRLGRNLHDGAQQRLASASLLLQSSQAKLQEDSPARDLVATALEELRRAQEELRDLARGLHPVALGERGLESALRALTTSSAFGVELDVSPERLPAQVEVAVYYTVAEALANVTKYAGATRVRVSVRSGGDDVLVEVADDGRGGADPRCGSGLRGLADRVESLGGRLEIESRDGSGTIVRAVVPL